MKKEVAKVYLVEEKQNANVSIVLGGTDDDLKGKGLIMKHRDTATEIKIWSEGEINCPKCRPKGYTNTYIHAIEPGSSKGMYIVEVTMPKYCKED